jgi:hypothetical protein
MDADNVDKEKIRSVLNVFVEFMDAKGTDLDHKDYDSGLDDIRHEIDMHGKVGFDNG